MPMRRRWGRTSPPLGDLPFTVNRDSWQSNGLLFWLPSGVGATRTLTDRIYGLGANVAGTAPTAAFNPTAGLGWNTVGGAGATYYDFGDPAHLVITEGVT